MNLSLVQKFSRLATFQDLSDPELLRSTPYWAKRDYYIANPRKLMQRPVSRSLGVIQNLGRTIGLTQDEVDEFVTWSQGFITEPERVAKSVKDYERRNGHYKMQRLLLTNKNAIELYIQTVLKK